MKPAVTMTLADDSCQVRSWDELGDVRILTASSRGPRLLLRLGSVPTAGGILVAAGDEINYSRNVFQQAVGCA